MSGSGLTKRGRSRKRNKSCSLEDISDTELPEDSITFSRADSTLFPLLLPSSTPKNKSFNNKAESTLKTRLQKQQHGEKLKNDKTIILDGSNVSESSTPEFPVRKSNKSSSVEYDPNSGSLLFAKEQSIVSSTPVVNSKSRISCKRKASTPEESCNKRSKTSEEHSKNCQTIAVTPFISSSSTKEPKPNKGASPRCSRSATNARRNSVVRDSSISDARGSQWNVASDCTGSKEECTKRNAISTQSPKVGTGRLMNGLVTHGRNLISTNCYNFAPEDTQRVRGSLRPIIIDGSNVAMAHLNNGRFSCRGIKLCIEYFVLRGHSKIVAFVPQYRHKRSESVDTYILDELQSQGILKFTPSREIGRTRFVPYDDRYIIQYAHDTGGIIVSNDNYRDLYDENPMWRDTIRNRVLSFTWIDENYLMFPQDPLGRYGPTLSRFLCF